MFARPQSNQGWENNYIRHVGIFFTETGYSTYAGLAFTTNTAWKSLSASLLLQSPFLARDLYEGCVPGKRREVKSSWLWQMRFNLFRFLVHHPPYYTKIVYFTTTFSVFEKLRTWTIANNNPMPSRVVDLSPKRIPFSTLANITNSVGQMNWKARLISPVSEKHNPPKFELFRQLINGREAGCISICILFPVQWRRNLFFWYWKPFEAVLQKPTTTWSEILTTVFGWASLGMSLKFLFKVGVEFLWNCTFEQYGSTTPWVSACRSVLQ